MKLKSIFIIIMIFLVTGCTVDANVKLNYDYSVNEEIKIYYDNKLAVNYDSPSDYAKNYISYYNSAIRLKKYNYEIIDGKEESLVKFNKKEKNICDSIKYSLFSNYLYSDISCEEENGFYTIKSVGNQMITLPQNQKKFNVEKVRVSVELPISADEHNADNVSGTTYTWLFDEDSRNDKSIVLKISKNQLEKNKKDVERKQKNKEVYDKIKIVTVILLVFVIISTTCFILYKKYRSNKIEY